MFADTAGLVSVLDESDEHHHSSVEHFSRAKRLVVHTLVIAEIIPVCQRRRMPVRRTLDFIDELMRNPSVQVMHVDERLLARGLELLRSRLDKRWSLCDAVSFVLMNDLGFREALTTDRHFEQAGFVRLLK